MSGGARKFEVDFNQGIFKTDGTAADAEALQRFLDRPEMFARMGRNYDPATANPQPAPVPPSTPERRVTKPFLHAIEGYLSEKGLENVGKTLNEKRGLYSYFAERHPGIDTNAVIKTSAVDFKDHLLSDLKTKNSQLNKKVSYLKDFFDYAKNHGHYDFDNERTMNDLFVTVGQALGIDRKSVV